MPRRPRQPHGKLGSAVAEAIEAAGLSPLETAVAARLSKGTIYKIIGGETTNPHHATLRRICKVLRIPLAELIGAEQLELLDEKIEETGQMSALTRLLIEELEGFPTAHAQTAAQVTAVAVLEVRIGSNPDPAERPLRQMRQTGRPAALRALVRRELEGVAPTARAAAVRSGLGALLDLRIMLGENVTCDACRRLKALRADLWSSADVRKRKGPRRAPASPTRRIRKQAS